METALLAAGTALWLGILTSISPCPLATNIAAVSFISRRIGTPRSTLLAGIFYTAGRSLTYLVLGIVLITSLLSSTELSHLLQKYMNKALGPLLILVGMFLLELLSLNLPSRRGGGRLEERAGNWGVWGAGTLGLVFALSFCPISAALFFGSLLPLSLKHGSRILFPFLYGIGTGLPVFVISLLLTLGMKSLGEVFHRVTRFELWARRVTGLIFIAVGIYYTFTYIFEA